MASHLRLVVTKPPRTYAEGYLDGLADGQKFVNRQLIAMTSITTLLAALAIVGAAFLLSGCAAFEPPITQEMVNSLNSGEIEAAIRAAKPGVPR